MWDWLVRQWQWPLATLVAACFLLALVPLIAIQSGMPLALIFLQLPLYMLHQGEEHVGDRFRGYINRIIGRGQVALTPRQHFGSTSWGSGWSI